MKGICLGQEGGGFKGTEKRVTRNQIQEIQEAGQRAADLNSGLVSLGERVTMKIPS